ncbi:MAG: hypothetical protein EHM40_02165 [Chloroflexi bacterium]|nr:MAG: hypothetical protein EHM40_15315 [Chloroflexota bacterium]RPI95963.1 MAG: hypothetical protein EHM40_02165 [Chloroflexota bacterium]
MYLGHFAVGLAAKPVAPKASLGILLVATQVIDILYPVFLIAGIGRLGGSVWDHGLVMSLVWSAVAFGIFCAVSRDMRSGLLVGFLVFSHWIGDFIAYRVLPIAFNDLPKVGLGLYSSLPAMLIWDFGLFSLALAYYLFRTKAKDRIGKWAPWLLVLYLILLMPAAMLPGKLIAVMALGMALVLPIGMWIDRHRSVIPVPGKKPGMLKA